MFPRGPDATTKQSSAQRAVEELAAGLFVVSQHVWSPQWLVSPTCLRWHVCGKPACLEPASARFSDMFAMSTGSLKRDWRELTARVQN